MQSKTQSLLRIFLSEVLRSLTKSCRVRIDKDSAGWYHQSRQFTRCLEARNKNFSWILFYLWQARILSWRKTWKTTKTYRFSARFTWAQTSKNSTWYLIPAAIGSGLIPDFVKTVLHRWPSLTSEIHRLFRFIMWSWTFIMAAEMFTDITLMTQSASWKANAHIIFRSWVLVCREGWAP